MSLHVDIFFGKKDSQVRKKVYLTAIYGCDNAMKHGKGIADALLAQFKLGNPLVESMYVRSDNTSCYHEALVQ